MMRDIKMVTTQESPITSLSEIEKKTSLDEEGGSSSSRNPRLGNFLHFRPHSLQFQHHLRSKNSNRSSPQSSLDSHCSRRKQLSSSSSSKNFVSLPKNSRSRNNNNCSSLSRPSESYYCSCTESEGETDYSLFAKPQTQQQGLLRRNQKLSGSQCVKKRYNQTHSDPHASCPNSLLSSSKNRKKELLSHCHENPPNQHHHKIRFKNNNNNDVSEERVFNKNNQFSSFQHKPSGPPTTVSLSPTTIRSGTSFREVPPITVPVRQNTSFFGCGRPVHHSSFHFNHHGHNNWLRLKSPFYASFTPTKNIPIHSSTTTNSSTASNRFLTTSASLANVNVSSSSTNNFKIIDPSSPSTSLTQSCSNLWHSNTTNNKKPSRAASFRKLLTKSKSFVFGSSKTDLKKSNSVVGGDDCEFKRRNGAQLIAANNKPHFDHYETPPVVSHSDANNSVPNAVKWLHGFQPESDGHAQDRVRFSNPLPTRGKKICNSCGKISATTTTSSSAAVKTRKLRPTPPEGKDVSKQGSKDAVMGFEDHCFYGRYSGFPTAINTTSTLLTSNPNANKHHRNNRHQQHRSDTKQLLVDFQSLRHFHRHHNTKTPPPPPPSSTSLQPGGDHHNHNHRNHHINIKENQKQGRDKEHQIIHSPNSNTKGHLDKGSLFDTRSNCSSSENIISKKRHSDSYSFKKKKEGDAVELPEIKPAMEEASPHSSNLNPHHHKSVDLRSSNSSNKYHPHHQESRPQQCNYNNKMAKVELFEIPRPKLKFVIPTHSYGSSKSSSNKEHTVIDIVDTNFTEISLSSDNENDNDTEDAAYGSGSGSHSSSAKSSKGRSDNSSDDTLSEFEREQEHSSIVTGSRLLSFKKSFWAKSATSVVSPSSQQPFRDKNDTQRMIHLLSSVPLFRKLGNTFLTKLSQYTNEVNYDCGEYIIRQGSRGEYLYILMSGTAKVTFLSNRNGEEIYLKTLHPGDFFGEKGLQGSKINKNCVMTTDETATCLQMAEEGFDQLMAKSGDVKNRFLDKSKQTSLNEGFGRIELEDLRLIATLGIGGFGRVELVTLASDQNQSFALKKMKKCQIVATRQVEHIKSEKSILLETNCDFITKLYKTFQDEKYLYMMMECCLGGELWTILRDKGHFNDHTARFYVGCVLEALKYLHNKNIIYRDLKPENLLLDTNGYLKLVDFGFAKRLEGNKTWTFCGTPEYVAPEVVLNKGHGITADYWSLGVLIYELLTGTPPFVGGDPIKTYKLILKGIDYIEFPETVSKHAYILIRKLCRENPEERLGYHRGLGDIKRNKWFDGLDWSGLRAKSLPPPIIPRVQGPHDNSNFDNYRPDSTGSPPNELSGFDWDF